MIGLVPRQSTPCFGGVFRLECPPGGWVGGSKQPPKSHPQNPLPPFNDRITANHVKR